MMEGQAEIGLFGIKQRQPWKFMLEVCMLKGQVAILPWCTEGSSGGTQIILSEIR